MRTFTFFLVFFVCVFSLQAQYSQGLNIYPSSAVIQAGNSLQFIVVALDENQTHINPQNVRWYATGGSITQNGLFTASQQDGHYTITVMRGRHQANASVQIKGAYAQISRIEIQPYDARLTPGQTATFQARAYDVYNRPCNAYLTWQCEGGNIDQSGVYRAGYQSGTFRVWARDRHTGVQGEARVFIQTNQFPPGPPEPPYNPHNPHQGQASIAITSFDTGGNFFSPKVKMTVQVTGRSIQSVRLYAVNNDGNILQIDAATCKNGDSVYLNGQFNRFNTKYFEVRLFDNMSRVVAVEKRDAR